jgi:hypothetical protein
VIRTSYSTPAFIGFADSTAVPRIVPVATGISGRGSIRTSMGTGSPSTVRARSSTRQPASTT